MRGRRGRWALAAGTAAVLAAVSTVAADAVKLTNNLNYEPVQVTSAAGGTLQFRLAGGRTLAKPLTEVAQITLVGQAQFNRAEALFAEGKFDQAEPVYAAADQAVGRAWQKELVGIRRLQAADGAGRIDRAVGQWLALVDAAGGAGGLLSLRPSKLAAAKDKANDAAIEKLVTRLKESPSPAYTKAIRELLVNLYERQGRLPEAQAIAAKLAGSTAPPTGTGGEQAPPSGSANAQIRLAELALKGGDYAKVRTLLESRVSGFSRAELPSAMYLLGRAQLAIAGGLPEDQARPMLLAAGLNLMRVAALFRNAEEAPDSLLAAGQVNEKLGNPAAARAAYTAVIDRYATSQAAGQARQALARLAKQD